jgi:hypothetical protein
MQFSDSAVSFAKVRVVDGNIRTTSLLVETTFVELRVIAVRIERGQVAHVPSQDG